MLARKHVLAGVLAGAMSVPAVALAEVVELPVQPPPSTTVTAPTTTTPAAPLTAACPADCVVLAKVTGYQSRSGTFSNPMVAPKSGRIVAWSITLGKPSSEQLKFFKTESKLGESEANITVLTQKKSLNATVAQQTPPVKLEKYFGSTVQFPLTRSISVKKGQQIGLTTKTWVPAMAVNQASTSFWRASRGKGQCDDTSGRDFSQSTLKQTVQYRCRYKGVQLLYGVTIVTNPPKK